MKFKFGDKVRIVDGAANGHTRGDIGIVTEVTPNLLYPYSVTVGSESGPYEDIELELFQGAEAGADVLPVLAEIKGLLIEIRDAIRKRP